MKNILLLFVSFVLLGLMSSSCHFAKTYDMGDTVAASVFEPEDTMLQNKKKNAVKKQEKTIIDSVGIYYIGDGSTREYIQLVSYPSKRDTMMYGKTRHVRVKGSADFNSVVRVKYYVLNGKDSLVREVEQIILDK